MRIPSFDDLDDGDLKHHTDFRRVYATPGRRLARLCRPSRSSARALRRCRFCGRLEQTFALVVSRRASRSESLHLGERGSRVFGLLRPASRHLSAGVY